MDPFIIAAIISAIVIIVLTIAFLRVTQVKQSKDGLVSILVMKNITITSLFDFHIIVTAGAKPRAVAQRDGGPGRVQAVRNQRARMRANGI